MTTTYRIFSHGLGYRSQEFRTLREACNHAEVHTPGGYIRDQEGRSVARVGSTGGEKYRIWPLKTATPRECRKLITRTMGSDAVAAIWHIARADVQ